MKQYVVATREVHIQLVVVDAENEADAIARVADGDGDYGSCDYDERMEPETWTVEEG